MTLASRNLTFALALCASSTFAQIPSSLSDDFRDTQQSVKDTAQNADQTVKQTRTDVQTETHEAGNVVKDVRNRDFKGAQQSGQAIGSGVAHTRETTEKTIKRTREDGTTTVQRVRSLRHKKTVTE